MYHSIIITNQVNLIQSSILSYSNKAREFRADKFSL